MDIDYTHLPQHIREDFRMYIEKGVPQGSFMTALLSNNLKETFARANRRNRASIPAYVDFLYWSVPSNIWGSEEKVEAHIRKKQILRNQEALIEQDIGEYND